MSQIGLGAKTDPELLRQLQDTAAGASPVEAVVRLRPDDPTQIVPSPERTEELVRQVLDRVKQRVGSKESRYNVFRNLGSFVLSANPEFIRELISQPEVATVAANRQSESAVIAPVKKARVKAARGKMPSRSAKKSKARSSVARAAPASKSAK
jgi:hypothetical protein